jgi:hypothetical protein
MTLRQARCQFTRALASLIIHATALGYEVALDEVTEHLTKKDPTSDHMPNSLHHIGLAADLNLYKDGVYLDMTIDHEPLGIWWEKLGDTLELPLCWGGRFRQPDGNHYSLAWLGRK